MRSGGRYTLAGTRPRALLTPVRGVTYGARKQTNFSEPSKFGHPPNMKQAPAQTIPRRIPGTTKINYTNEKGRQFSFSIPVAQLTHPPLVRSSSSPSGWKSIDTSYCDVGDLEDDMPSAVDDCLRKHTYEENGELFVRLDSESLLNVHAAFVALCREYVLMDTRGMKTTLTYSELNSGPDYEMYDRKGLRRRHWLSIRHRFEDIRELLWPAPAVEGEAADATAPLLSCADMHEALTWVEAASTLCVRARRPYDTAAENEFIPLDLSREVSVLAAHVRADPSAFFRGEGTVNDRSCTDRFVFCAAMCAKHGVPFSSFLTNDAAATSGATQLLHVMPTPTTPKDAIRMMSVLVDTEATASSSRSTSSSSKSSCLCFSNDQGDVTKPSELSALAALCHRKVFGELDALKNADEEDICIMMRFAVGVRENNRQCFASTRGVSDGLADDDLSALRHFIASVVSRCRYLLYRLGGPQTSVMSGDEERIPVVELQKHAEQSHPLATVHHKIGMMNAQGLRFARLGAKSSATLVELLDRLEASGEHVGLHTLVGDLVHHIAHKVSAGQGTLSLKDIVRVLPLIARKLAAEPQMRPRYERLLSSLGTAIGAELRQEHHDPEDMASVFEGLAACQYVPVCFTQMEMVTLRLSLHSGLSLPVLSRSLTAMAKLVGPRNVSSALLQSAASMAVKELEAGHGDRQPDTTAVLDALSCLSHCHYSAFPELMLRAVDTWTLPQRADWPAHQRCAVGVLCAFASGSLPDDNTHCAALIDVATLELSASLSTELDARQCGADLSINALRACAALNIDPKRSGRSFAQTEIMHSMCTPLLAVGLMESLETLSLSPSPLYAKHAAYVEGVLDLLASREGTEGLLKDDADVAVRVLYLQHAPPELAKKAVDVLTNEMNLLASSLTKSSHMERQPHSSFEHVQLLKREGDDDIEARLSIYYDAVQQRSSV